MKQTFYVLCAGRHEIPEEIAGMQFGGYIYDEVPNVLDFKSLNDRAFDFCEAREGGTTWSAGPAQVDYTDVEQLYHIPLDVVVTGLTAACVAVIRACVYTGTPLTLWHYNRDTGEYVPQIVV